MAKAKVKRKVPTVDLIRNQKVMSANSAASPMIGNALTLGPSGVPSANKVAPGQLNTIDSLSQQITKEEMDMNLAVAAMGPTLIDNTKVGGTVESVGTKKIKVKRKK